MGQYYKPVNLDKRSFVNAEDYGCGIKLMEHSWILNPFVNAVAQLLAPGYEWYKTRIVWCGDYMDEGAFLEKFPKKKAAACTLYSFARSYFRALVPRIADGPSVRYLINHTRREFVDLNHMVENTDGMAVHPLPILTCAGNGRGGGDYRGESHLVGTWAANVISTAYTAPARFRELTVDFIDE